MVKTRRFDGLRGEVGQKLETPFSTIRYLSIDEGAALWLRIRTFRVTCLIRTLLHALYLINNNFRILFSRINDQKSIRVWNRKTIIIYTFENWLMLIGDLWREWQKCRRKLVRGLFLSLVSRSLNNWFKNWRKISKQSRMLAGNRGHPRALRSFSLLEAKCRGVYSSVQHISPAVCKPSKRL